jgi:iron complex outermembrane receptor protein
LSRRLVLNAGIRYDHHSQHGGIVAPEFGATFRFAGDYSLSVAAGKGFRYPTIRELYLFPAPNPSLEPERLWNFQGTFQLKPHRSLLMWATGYYADIDNTIVTTGRFPNLALENSGRALNRGVEINGRWQPRRLFSINGGYAHLRSTNPAPYAPAHKFNYSLDLDLERFFLSLGGVSAGRAWTDFGRTRRLGPYTVISLKGTFPLGKGTSAYVMIDNLFNRRYQVVADYTMPGVNAMGGIRFKF